VRVDDDLAAARDAMRPFIALYVGGMGSRERNFYNQLVARYGFEDAAREIQDHYLAGDRGAAMAAIPDALIDAVTLAGPPDRVLDRLRAFRDAGVGTVSVGPIARSPDVAAMGARRPRRRHGVRGRAGGSGLPHPRPPAGPVRRRARARAAHGAAR